MQLIVPVYLNQKLVFDLVAMMQGGIATVTKVTESNSRADESKTNVDGSFGMAEALSSLLKINLSGHMSDTQNAEVSRNTTEERIHTPASLFCEFRSRLEQQDQIKSVEEGLPSPGDFVEFEASLSRNPIIVGLDALIKLMELSELFSKEKNTKKKKGQGNKPSEVQVLTEQFSSLSVSLKEGGSRDLVAKLEKDHCNVVLTVEEQFLNDTTMSDIADGTFRVLGKVVRSFSSDTESINLLRKTPLAHAPEVMKEFVAAFKGLDQEKFSMPEMEANITGPAIQVLPIAIYS